MELLSDIVLGMLLASQSVHLKASPEQLLKTWQEHPPWQTVENLTAAFAATHWQEWLRIDDPENPNKPVYRWTDPFRQQRLTVSDRLAKTNQPLLQAWLKQLAQGEVKELTSQLETAWNEAQKTAQFFAQIFTALADLHYQEELFDEEQPTSEEATYRALAAVVLGDMDQQLEAVVSHWLFANLEEQEILKTFHYLKECFARIVTVTGNHTLPALGEAVHGWAKVCLEETLKDSNLTGLEDLSGLTYSNTLTSPWATLGDSGKAAVKPDRSSRPVRFEHNLWNLLERSRIGLLGLSFKFTQDDWAEEVGKKLWDSLKTSVRLLINGHQPTDQEMWLPLQTWLQEITRLQLVQQPPTVAEGQRRLSDHEALVQPFFDPTQRRLRILWLDKTQGLILRDLPAECRDQACWYNADKTGICDRWEEIWKDSDEPNIDEIMTSPPVTSMANRLRQWADSSQITQLTVIFPAPLGQLPWEMLEPVADLLVRTVSVAKRYTSHAPASLPPQSPTTANETHWVMGIGNLDDNLRCCNTEARWVATQWHTTPELPTRPMLLFDALQKLTSAKNIHLSTHGNFDRANPLASGLLLSGLKDDKATTLNILPLWLCSAMRIPGEILILSACQSNVSGQQTEGLLSPIGLGPALSAAGTQVVIGCLWSVNEVATLTFVYHLLTLAKERPNTPWHQLATLARWKVRDMKRAEMKEMLRELGVGVTKGDYCHFVTDSYIHGQNERPLSHPYYWAGFNVIT